MINMKKAILAFPLVLISVILGGQAPFPSRNEIKQFSTSKTFTKVDWTLWLHNTENMRRAKGINYTTEFANMVTTATSVNNLGEIYKNCLQKGLRFKHTEKHYLEDVDDAFYCAEYLRAWVFEGQLRAALVEKFGEEWFLSDKAGSYLRELWSYGQKFKADELVQTVGYIELEIEPLVQEIELGLKE